MAMGCHAVVVPGWQSWKELVLVHHALGEM
jgi:hypothetical protein